MLCRAVVSRHFSLGRALGFVAAMALAANGLMVSACAENNAKFTPSPSHVAPSG